MNNLKTELKEKKAELKKLDTEITKLEEQKAAFDAKAAADAQKAELEETIQKLMTDGVSAAEILEKFRYKRPSGCSGVWHGEYLHVLCSKMKVHIVVHKKFPREIFRMGC